MYLALHFLVSEIQSATECTVDVLGPLDLLLVPRDRGVAGGRVPFFTADVTQRGPETASPGGPGDS